MLLPRLLFAMLVSRASAFGLGQQIQRAPNSFIPHRPSASVTIRNSSGRRRPELFLSGGFGSASSRERNKKGGKGKGSQKLSTAKKMNPRDAKRANQQLAERYGGDIGKGTQERIQTSLESLQPHLKEAAELYKAVTQFDALVAPMTPSDQNRLILPIQSQMAEEDRKKLKSIMEEHGLSERELHNIYQRVTWDAAADAKATQADIVGNQMKSDLQDRITKACKIAVGSTECEGALGRVLDVGCGHGAIVRSLVDAGLGEPDMYVGIDLSEEMVKNAVHRYGSARNSKTGKGRMFVAGDFYAHDFGGEGIFDSVIFCSALHDLPDMEAAISKASSLLRSGGGKVIVVHAQGAQHVLGQNQANPVMVRRGLPTAKEWGEMIYNHAEWGLNLNCEPADPRSDREENEGYLAVLSRT